MSTCTVELLSQESIQSLPICTFHGFKLPSNWANDVFMFNIIVTFIYYYLFRWGMLSPHLPPEYAGCVKRF